MVPLFKPSFSVRSIGALFALARGAAHSASGKASPLASIIVEASVQPSFTIDKFVSYLFKPSSL